MEYSLDFDFLRYENFVRDYQFSLSLSLSKAEYNLSIIFLLVQRAECSVVKSLIPITMTYITDRTLSIR